MGRMLQLVFVLGVGYAAIDGGSALVPAAQSQPAGGRPVATKAQFVGTWKLVSIERRTAKGELIPPTGPSSIGFIMYDPAGYMGVTIMPGGRKPYAGEQPTPAEARAAVATYTSYYGTYTVDGAAGFVTHHLQGSLNPNMAPDQKRFFELSGNRITLKPPAAADGSQSRLTWEKVPDLPNMTPAHRRFVGFWKLISNERRNMKGQLVSSNPGQTGYIIYSASGQMAVHMKQPDRKPYAGATPTPDEALAALGTYTSYFGPTTLHEPERYIVHHRIGIVNPGQIGTDAQRFYEFSGRRLMLKPPVATVDGQQVQGTITWEKVSE